VGHSATRAHSHSGHLTEAVLPRAQAVTKAQDKLQKLKMTGGNIDKYISELQMLEHQAHMDLNDPAAMRLFARGLPNALTDACVDLDGPESFEQWRNAAQRQHRAWLEKQAIHHDYNKPPAPKP